MLARLIFVAASILCAAAQAQSFVVVNRASNLPFDPASVPTLKAKLDFDDLTTLFTDTAGTTSVTTAGNSIARINNKGTLGGYFYQNTSTARPTYNTFTGSKMGAVFDGGDWLVYSGSAADFNFFHNGARRVYVCEIYLAAAPADFYSLLDSSNGSAFVYGYQGYFLPSRAWGSRAARNVAHPGWNYIFGSLNNVYPLTTGFVFTERFEDSSADAHDLLVRADGVSIGTSDRLNAPASNDASFTMTIARTANTASGFLNGRIRRLWIWHLPTGYSDNFLPVAEAAIVK